MMRTNEKQKKKDGHYVKNVNIANNIIGYLLSNPIFQTVFNIEEISFDVYFFPAQ